MKILFPLFFLLSNCLGCNRNTCTLTAGCRIDAENVLVKISAGEGFPYYYAVQYTRASGNVRFEHLPPGRYRLYCNWLDHARQFHEFNDWVVLSARRPSHKIIDPTGPPPVLTHRFRSHMRHPLVCM